VQRDQCRRDAAADDETTAGSHIGRTTSAHPGEVATAPGTSPHDRTRADRPPSAGGRAASQVRGELLNMTWPAVDLDAGELILTGSTDVIDGERVYETTKTGRSRVVSLDPGTVTVLREHRRRQVTERLAAGPLWVETGHVFTTTIGEPVHPDTVTKLMAALIRSHNEPAIAGRGKGHPRRPLPKPDEPLPAMRLHDLRHVHATTLLLAGVPVHVVANQLGHADPSITLRVYAHVLREQAAGVAEVFARAIDAAVSKGVSR
jgi:integrase